MDKFYYAVYHCWKKDHYNAQVWVNDLLCVFDSLEKAEEFKKKYEKPTDDHGWYKKGIIAIEKMPATYDETKFWWLKEPKTIEQPVTYATREELAKIPKSNIPFFFKFREKEI